MRYDLTIRGGTIVDGDGGEPYVADIAILGDRIAEIGEGPFEAEEVIAAGGLLITPGFVDIHTHYDGQLTWSSRMQPSSQHGVTTVVTGNCGVGFAPCRPHDHQRLIELMEGVEDIPEVVMTEGIPWGWESFPDYLDLLARTPYDVDVAAMLPHAALRVYVMGDRAVRREDANPTDIGRMADLVGDALDAGAIGFGTSRSLNHRTLAGELIPTVSAGEDELMAIARAFRKKGTGVLQIILPEFENREALREGFKLLRRLVETSGRPLSFSLNQKFSDPGAWRELLTLTEQANADGLDIRAQVMGRPIGALIGHEVTLNPFIDCPTYKELATLPFDDKIAELRDPAIRRLILDEFHALPESGAKQTRFERMFPLSDPPDYEPRPEESMAAHAERMGVAPEALVYDVLLEEGGHRLILLMALGYADGNLEPSYAMIKSDSSVLGLGDGGAHCGIICDASHTTSMLTHWTRDRTRGEKLTIPEAVRAMTADTARAVGLLDRGLIRQGYMADLNIIDYERLRLRLPNVAYDLPAGGKRLHQRAEGYVATIKSGVVTYREGEPTGALPGKLIRGAQVEPEAMAA